jgi:hypothetical protein
MVIWNILRTFGIFHDHYVGIFYVRLVHFGIMYQEKSGNLEALS